MTVLTNKLLGQILGYTIYDHAIGDETLTYVYDAIGERRTFSINIHSLTHKVKQKLFNSGYLVTTIQAKDCSYLCFIDLKITLNLSGHNKGGSIKSYRSLVRSDTELEAILYAYKGVTL